MIATKVFFGIPVSTHEMTLVTLHKLLNDNPKSQLFVVKMDDPTLKVKSGGDNHEVVVRNIGFFIGFLLPDGSNDGFEDDTFLGPAMILTTYELSFDVSSQNVCTGIKQVQVFDKWNLDENNKPTWIYTPIV